MKTKLSILMLVFCCVFLSCDKSDDDSTSVSNFYKGADTSASVADLTGIWAIFNVGFQGDVAEVPVVYPDCGRDFIIFSENGIYTEYLFQHSGCEYQLNSLNWSLNKGIINLFNEFGQSEELVITKLNANELVFKMKLDVDEDGTLDVVNVFLKPYTPKEIDIVTPTFKRNQDAAFDQLLSFSWQSYQGFNDFERYEVYRSIGGNCNFADAELIATISEVNTTVFTDLTPPAEAYLCYYLKVYTDRGLLGQSYGHFVHTENIRAQPVTLYKPDILGSAIQFNWQASTDPYFSHYELAFSNFGGGYATGQQVYSVAIINDREVTKYLDEHPPLLENPFYVLYVHNIFGNRTEFYNSQVTTFQEVPFKRPEILSLSQVQSYTIDPENTVVYFYGKEGSSRNMSHIHRFNYSSNQTEAISNLGTTYTTNIPIKYINSGYGGEIIVEQGSDLAVYDAMTLKYKYTLDLKIQGANDFSYSSLGYWIVVNKENIYTYVRDNANMNLVDTKPHFSNYQNSNHYKAFVLRNNNILLGHYNEPNSYLYALSANGTMTQEQMVPIPIKANWEGDSRYNATGNYVINFSENRLYSTANFTLMESFESPYFPSGTSKDGGLIFGSNNDPDWQITEESIHAKEAVIYNRQTQKSSTVSTIGYPHVIFENAFGDIISISSGLKKDDIGQNINDKGDLFLEVIQWP
ncbi:lipocalin family protein [Gelidibacter japonicus]|uniref:lipocalin family protein n=1 Tax=Gelidibacter japonicus TaxID=1962232 RepID=UPI0020225E78|nr:lipocalin family protein [Gelidibacter japonicus]MCL8007609.1 lipocalin family protein [Gelidibacter japonicus]